MDAALLEVVEKLKTTLETVETPNVAWGRTVGKRMDALSLKRHHQLETQIMQLVQQAEREELAEKERNRFDPYFGGLSLDV